MVDMQTESELDLDCDLVLDDVSCLGLLSCKDEFAVATPSATSDLMIARDLTEAVIAAQLSDNFWRCPSDPAGDFTSGNSTPETVTSTAKAAVTAPVTSTVPRRPTPKRRRARVAPRRSSAAPSEESHETQPAVSPVMPSPWLWMHPHPASLGMGASLAVSHLHQQHCFQQTLAYAHSLCGQCPAPLYNQGSQFFGYAPLHCPSNYISQARRALPHDSVNVSKEEKDHADAVLVMAVTSKQHQHSSDASCVTQSDSYHQQDQQVISSRCKPGAPERSNLQLDRQIASQRKSKRRQQDKDLLHQLDDMLPMAARSKQRKSAGYRALGTSGRSQLTVLGDVVRYMRLMLPRGRSRRLPAPGQEPVPHLCDDLAAPDAAAAAAGGAPPWASCPERVAHTAASAAPECIEGDILSQAFLLSETVASAIIDLPSWTIRSPSRGMCRLLLAPRCCDANGGDGVGAEGSGEVAQASGTPKPVRVGLRKRKPAEGGAAAAGGAGPRAAPSTLVKVKSPKAAVRGCGSEVGTLDDEAGDGDEEPCSDWSSESVAGKSLSEFLVTQDQARLEALERALLWGEGGVVDQRLTLAFGPGDVVFSVGWLSGLSVILPSSDGSRGPHESYGRLLLYADVSNTNIVTQ